MSNRSFPVTSPIDHDGKRYEIDSKITLSDAQQIEALQAAKAIGEEIKAETAAERKAREAAEEEAERHRLMAVLYGSDKQPAQVPLGKNKTIALGDVVRRAFTDSGLTVDAWNALPAAEREAAIESAIETLKEEAKK